MQREQKASQVFLSTINKSFSDLSGFITKHQHISKTERSDYILQNYGKKNVRSDEIKTEKYREKNTKKNSEPKVYQYICQRVALLFCL